MINFQVAPWTLVGGAIAPSFFIQFQKEEYPDALDTQMEP